MDEEEKNKSLSDSEMTGTTDEAVNVLGVQTGVLNNTLKLMDGKYGGAFYVRYICDTGRGCGWLQLIIKYPTGMVLTQLLCKNICKISSYEEDGLGEVEGISYQHKTAGEMAVYKPHITDSMRSGFYDSLRTYERPNMPIPMRVLWQRIVENYSEIPVVELTIKSSLQDVYETLIDYGEDIIQRDVKPTAGTRVLPMSDEVYDAFKRVISGRKKPRVEQMIDGVSGFLFLDDRGKPMLAYQWEKKFQHIVEKYNKIYKVELPKITPHICRHTYCTNMAKSGIAVKTLQYLMGHADIATTLNVYTHLKLEDAKDELEQMKVREQLKKELALVDMEYAKKELKRVSSI